MNRSATMSGSILTARQQHSRGKSDRQSDGSTSPPLSRLAFPSACSARPSPTCVERAAVSNGEIGRLFVAQSVGYLIGALLCGRLFDRGGGHRAIAGGLAGIALAALMIPHVSSVAALCVPIFLIGLFGACVDVGGNTLVVWHSRGHGSARLLNALHLFFGIGALVSPGLVNRSLAWTSGLGVVVGVIALCALVVAVIILRHAEPVATAGDLSEGVDGQAVPTPKRILIVISVFFFLYVGVEIGFSGWLKTYAEDLPLPGKSSPTLLNTLFWVSFTLGRLAATVLAKRLRSGLLLASSCGLTVVLLLAMVVADGQPAAVWVTTALLGFAVAPQFATMIAYAEEHLELSGRATSWFVSASGLGGLALPFLIGTLFDTSGSRAMPITVGIAAAVATLWLIVVRRELSVTSRRRELQLA